MEPLSIEWEREARSAWYARVRAREFIPPLATPLFVAASVVLTALAQPQLFAADTLVSLDTATQYYPWYAYLGQSLRAGHVPGWNAATFAGTPFAADPLSGWTYIPAMVVFALLPIGPAIRLYVLIHPLLAVVSTFALARVLGLSRAGALLAAIAYANTSFLQVQNVSSSPFASVYSWLPVALLGAELAVRASAWRTRLWWCGVSAFAMSQCIAVWPAQGAYYAGLVVGGYIAYRIVFVGKGGLTRGRLMRIADLLAYGAGIFGLAAAMDAAGILPRLEFNALSNLAGGYTGAEATVGGLHPKDWVLVAIPGFWYAGASVLALAIATPLITRGRLTGSIGFLGVLSIGALLISGSVETPLHWLLYHLLPGFGRLHPHAPERILTVAYLGPALLAGAALDALRQRGWQFRGKRLDLRRRAIATSLCVLVVAADLALGGAKARSDVLLRDPLNGADKLTPVEVETYFQPDTAARFLQQRFQAEGSSRFLGYAPYLRGLWWPYSTRFNDPATAALDVNNRALPLGLQDVQGYDAAHLERYDAYVAILNDRSQNYHDAEVFWAGLYSPLLDLLNVRYVIVPPPDRVDVSDAAALSRFSATVYQDRYVRILENPAALPRAWIVHAASQAAPGDALLAIDTGQVRARDVALLEEPPPPLALPTDATLDSADVTRDEADQLEIATSTQAAGLLVLSEVYYPAWHAYVDAQPVHLYVADGALRAIPVPAGMHRVELRFESATLTAGIALSLGTVIAFAALLLGAQALRRLPHDQTGLSLTDANGARDARGNSISQ